jgi:hypothetical protein
MENNMNHWNTLRLLTYCAVCFALLFVPFETYGRNNMGKESFVIPKDDRSMPIRELLEEFLLSKQSAGEIDGGSPRNIPRWWDIVEWCSLGQYIIWESVASTDVRSNPYLVELHKRFSIPCACLVFGLVGVPLGIHSKRAGKSGGYAISLFLLLIYYIFLAAGESLGDSGTIPAFFAVWTPNILLGSTGVILLARAAQH